jgi:hypothetical protein
MDGNPNFLNLPVELSDLNEALNNFEAAMAKALDGSRSAFANKRKCRSIVERLLRQLGHYVEHACNGNMEIFVTSGFEAIRAPSPAEQCPTPLILKIKQGKSGELLVSFTPFYRKAAHYQLRYGVVGTSPDSWTVETLLQARRPVRVENLTPGTDYGFQVRAFGKTGKYTDWSSQASRMCI